MKEMIIFLFFVAATKGKIFDHGAYMIPHPEKEHRGGEDAYLASEDVLAVADGVGGWADQGIDPGDYARALCNNILDQYYVDKPNYLSNPKSLLLYSHEHNSYPGSATLVILTLHPSQPFLLSSYMGDSGFVVFRLIDGEVDKVYQSPEQEHEFNFPYQLAANGMGDDPEKAIQVQIPIKINDVVVVGSDGLFDNVAVEEMREFVGEAMEKGTGRVEDKKKLAEILAKKANQYGKDKNYDSPFSKQARSLGYSYSGGKLDDTTVIVAQIIDTKDGENEQVEVTKMQTKEQNKKGDLMDELLGGENEVIREL